MTHFSKMYVDNSHTIRLDGLVDASGSYVNDATVTMESFTDKAGNAVSGVSVPLTMAYVATSNGRYEGALSESLEISRQKVYTATVKAISGSTQGQWTEQIIAVRRSD